MAPPPSPAGSGASVRSILDLDAAATAAAGEEEDKEPHGVVVGVGFGVLEAWNKMGVAVVGGGRPLSRMGQGGREGEGRWRRRKRSTSGGIMSGER